MSSAKRVYGWLSLVLLLSSCALFKPPSTPTNQLASAALYTLNDWRFQGRIAISSEEEGWQASLRWQQQGADFEVNIRGPLGQGAARLLGNPKQVRLHTAEGVYQAANAEQLIATHLGVNLPVSGFRYWVLGLPRPNHPYEQTLDEQQRVESLQQDGWDIRYTRYRLVERWMLPGKIILDNEQWRIRLVLDRWEFGDESD